MTYIAPYAINTPTRATILAATRDGAGSKELRLVPWPAQQNVFAVACYDDGVALHRASDGALLGVLALDGGTGDVAQVGDHLVAPSVTAPVLWEIVRSTGAYRAIDDVPTGNEVSGFRGAAYVTNRDIAGDGAFTRVRFTPAGQTVDRVRTGITAEGLAIDARGGVAYVSNVNDASVAVVDLAAMRVTRRFEAPERAFGIAYDAALNRVDVVANIPRTPVRPGGFVASIDVSSGRTVARSKRFVFPLGVALDPVSRRAFVSDEATGTVAVLDTRTLRSVHRPLNACQVAWRPAIDLVRRRLYVPCARANAVAAFDLRTLARVPGSPFRTAGYPLGIATLGAIEGRVALKRLSRRAPSP